MKILIKTFQKHSWSLVLALILLFGAWLRFYNYAAFPIAGETRDELAWSLLGGSLLQTGTPTSWSYFKPYQNTTIVELAGQPTRLVTPDLDHPPLFSLLPGAMLTITKQPWLVFPSMKLVRAPLVAVAILNLGLFTYWLTRLPISKTWQLSSLLIFASAPSFVFLSRLVVSENLLLTWILLIWCLLIWQPTRFKKIKQIGLFLTHAALPLTKISGLSVVVGNLVFFKLTELKNNKVLATAAIGSVIGCLIYLLYILNYDFNLFWQVQTWQTKRGVGLISFHTSFLWNLDLIHKVFVDGWLVFGFWSSFIFMVAFKSKNAQLVWWHKYLSVLFLALLGFLLFSVGENTKHGWYRIPLIPFFAFSSGWIADYVYRQKNWLGLAVVSLLLSVEIRTGLFYLLGKNLYGYQSQWQRIWLLFVGVMVLASVMNLSKKLNKQLFRLASLVTLLAVLVGHTLTVTQIEQQRYWEDEFFINSQIIPE